MIDRYKLYKSLTVRGDSELDEESNHPSTSSGRTGDTNKLLRGNLVFTHPHQNVD